MATMARLMPGPHNRDAPRFEGKRIKRFLEEFEALADAASLDRVEHCRHIVHYCRGEAEEFIESLEEYEDKDWDTLKSKLEELYPSEEEEHHYTRKLLALYSRKTRNITDMTSFDKYVRRFVVISRALEQKKMIAD
jgi:hypothetical protein